MMNSMQALTSDAEPPGSDPSNQYLVLFNKINGTGRVQYYQVDPGKLRRIIPKSNHMTFPKLKEATGFSVVVLNNFLYVLGGRHLMSGAVLNQCLQFNPRVHQWLRRAPMRKARTRFTADALDDWIFVAGGELKNGKYSESVECYDPATDTWTEMKGMPKVRADHASCTANGKLFVSGGLVGKKNVGSTSFWQYEPRTDYWIQATLRSQLPAERHKHMMIAHKDYIYCFGGLSLQPCGQQFLVQDDGSLLAFNINQLGDLDTHLEGFWRTDLPSMTFPRSLAAVACIGHNIFLLGGHNYSKEKDADEVEYFNTKKEKWSSCFPIDQGPYTNMACGVICVPATNREFSTMGVVMRNKWTLW